MDPEKMIEKRKRRDRQEETSPYDIICPPDKYVFNSPFISQFLAFTVERKVDRLNDISNLLITSTDDSDDQLDYLKQLAKLIVRDPRLGDNLDSKVVAYLFQLLEDNRECDIQYYSGLILSNIVSSRHGNVIKDESIPYLFNLIPSPDLFARAQALVTLTEIANVYPDSCDIMITNGALQLLESLYTNKDNCESLLETAGVFLTALCRMKQQIPSDMMIKVVRIISTGIKYDYELVLVQVCLALSILSDRRLIQIGFEATRLLELTKHPVYEVVISVLRTIGNYVRWGDDENIQFMIERDLLPLLEKLLCHEYTTVRKEACWIISNIAAHTNVVADLVLIDILIRLLKTDEFEVKEVAARAIFNVVSGFDKKLFTYFKENYFPLVNEVRSFYRDDSPVFTLCSEILKLSTTASSSANSTGNMDSEEIVARVKHLSIDSTEDLGCKRETREKMLKKGKKLSAASPTIPDLPGSDSKKITSTANSTENLGSEEIVARVKHLSIDSTKDLGCKRATREKKLKKGKKMSAASPTIPDLPGTDSKKINSTANSTGNLGSEEIVAKVKHLSIDSTEDLGCKRATREKKLKKGKKLSAASPTIPDLPSSDSKKITSTKKLRIVLKKLPTGSNCTSPYQQNIYHM